MYRLVSPWVLALLVVVGGIAGAEDKPDPVQGYKEFLKSLPKDDPESIDRARWKYAETIAPLGQDACGKAFLVFLDFHDCVCDTLCTIFNEKWWSITKDMGGNGSDAYKNESDALKKVVESKEVQRLVYSGVETETDADGGLYVRGIPESIPRSFSPYLPKSLRRYLELRKIEIWEGYCGDESLAISYARLAQRVGNWEEYLKAFPNSLVRDDVLIIRASYLHYLLTGSDNSQLDPETKDPAWNIQVIYKKFMRDYPGTFSAEMVRKNYDYFQKAGFFTETHDDDTPLYSDGKWWKEIDASLGRSTKVEPAADYWLGAHRDFSNYFRAVKQTAF